MYLDSIISSSAINIEFYKKVYALAPFGAGNPEPKFAIENLRPLSSKILKEKHIKSILIGQEGSTIKTMAFNSVDNEIGAYLLQKGTKQN